MTNSASINNGSVDQVVIYGGFIPSEGYEISDLVNEFNIYQSIDAPFLTAKMVVVDGVGLLNNAYLMGNEYVAFTYGVILPSGEKLQRTINFLVTGIEKLEKQGESFVYVLNLGSMHFQKNAITKISQSYSGKSSDIIAKVLKDKLGVTDELSLIEETSDNIKLVIPNLNISETLAFISRRAASLNGTPCFTYEHLDGSIEFSSIEGMYLRRPAFAYYRRDQKSTDPLSTYSTINTFQIDRISQGYENVVSGMYAAKVYAYDALTRNFVEHNFNIADKELDMTTFLNKSIYNPNISINGKSFNEIPESKTYTIITSSNGSNSLRPKITSNHDEVGDYYTNSELRFPFLNSKLQQLDNCLITIGVQGNSSIFPGSILNIVIPSNSAQINDEASKLDNFLSGNYVVVSVRHIFKQQSFITYAQIAKDSFGI